LNDSAHWNKTAQILGVFDGFFWSLGTVRQIQYLEEKGIVGPLFFSHLLDRNEYRLFRPIFVIIHKLIAQLQIIPLPAKPD
jgi:hypothetical protein